MTSRMSLNIGTSETSTTLSVPNDTSRSSIFLRWQPTIVFQTFWRFAAERQEIFYRRLLGKSRPWTADTTLATFKFTNPYRASDRVSQFLIREVIYNGDQSPKEIFFRTILFKLFNKIDTWLLLKKRLGEITARIALDQIDAILTRAMLQGTRIYSGAYIMPSGAGHLRSERKHRAHLSLLAMMLKDEVPERLSDCRHMDDAFRVLRSYPMLGDFLAYQYLVDLNYSDLINFPESEFVVPGPGAKSGLRKCFSNVSASDEVEIIKRVAEFQETEFSRRDLTFRYLAGRHLQLIDCQNLFCEIDKYARMAHPEVQTKSKRTRIKHKFIPRAEPLAYWFPPKWGINASFAADVDNAGSADQPLARAVAI
jgi:hypothetical protein